MLLKIGAGDFLKLVKSCLGFLVVSVVTSLAHLFPPSLKLYGEKGKILIF